MLRRVIVGILCLLAPLLSAHADDLAKADRDAVMQALHRWEQAWVDKDAELAARDYSDDADWTNAFGMRRIGREAIQELLEEVFQLPFVMAGSTSYEYHDFIYVGPGTILLRSHAIRTNQQLPSGTTEPPRRINHLRVFSKRGGRWVIISHLIADERTPGKPRE